MNFKKLSFLYLCLFTIMSCSPTNDDENVITNVTQSDLTGYWCYIDYTETWNYSSGKDSVTWYEVYSNSVEKPNAIVLFEQDSLISYFGNASKVTRFAEEYCVYKGYLCTDANDSVISAMPDSVFNDWAGNDDDFAYLKIVNNKLYIYWDEQKVGNSYRRCERYLQKWPHNSLPDFWADTVNCN